VRFVAGLLFGAGLLIALGIWWDARYVRQYQERERITIRPVPRYRPR
jgi:hypothetical protein